MQRLHPSIDGAGEKHQNPKDMDITINKYKVPNSKPILTVFILNEKKMEKVMVSHRYQIIFYKMGKNEIIKDDLVEKCLTFSDTKYCFFTQSTNGEELRQVIDDYLQLIHQRKKIACFSLWGTKPVYLYGAVENAIDYRQSDFTPRFYLDSSVPIEIANSLIMMGSEIIYMKKNKITEGTCWRFLGACDPDAYAVIFRDTDCRITERETRAVEEWLESDKGFHFMRDSSNHHARSMKILAGLWGIKKGYLSEESIRKIEDFVETIPLAIDSYRKGEQRMVDQIFLNNTIHPLTASRIVHNFPLEMAFEDDAKPFPINKISDDDFVGKVINFTDDEESIYSDFFMLNKDGLRNFSFQATDNLNQFHLFNQKILLDDMLSELDPIEKIIHITWKRKNFMDKEKEYSVLKNGVCNLKKMNPEYDFRIYDDDELEKYLIEKLPDEDYRLIKDRHVVEKTDLWRLLKIFYEGGIYMDIDRLYNIPLEKIITKDLKCMLPTYGDVDFSQDIIISSSQNPILQKAIEMNLEKRRNGCRDIMEMGPGNYFHAISKILLGKKINRFPSKNNLCLLRNIISECSYIETCRENPPFETVCYRGDKVIYDKNEFYESENVKRWIEN